MNKTIQLDELMKRYKSAIHTFGWMILAKRDVLQHKIMLYKKDLRQLQRQLDGVMPADKVEQIDPTNLAIIHTMSYDVSELIKASRYL